MKVNNILYYYNKFHSFRSRQMSLRFDRIRSDALIVTRSAVRIRLHLEVWIRCLPLLFTTSSDIERPKPCSARYSPDRVGSFDHLFLLDQFLSVDSVMTGS